MKEGISKPLKTFSFWLFLILLFLLAPILSFKLAFTVMGVEEAFLAKYGNPLPNWSGLCDDAIECHGLWTFLGLLLAWAISIPIIVLRAIKKISTKVTLCLAIVPLVIIPVGINYVDSTPYESPYSHGYEKRVTELKAENPNITESQIREVIKRENNE